jgi:hypothetical protein
MSSKIKINGQSLILPRCWKQNPKAEASLAPRRTMFEIKRRILKKLSRRLAGGGCFYP